MGRHSLGPYVPTVDHIGFRVFSCFFPSGLGFKVICPSVPNNAKGPL